MSKSNSIEIGPLADNAELKAFTHIISQALFFPGADLEVWLKREGEVNVRVARCQGKVTGGLIAQPMGQWFGGKSVPMASIRAVGVAPQSKPSQTTASDSRPPPLKRWTTQRHSTCRCVRQYI